MAIATLCLFRHLTTITERPFRALTSQKSLRDNYCSASVPQGIILLFIDISVRVLQRCRSRLFTPCTTNLFYQLYIKLFWSIKTWAQYFKLLYKVRGFFIFTALMFHHPTHNDEAFTLYLMESRIKWQTEIIYYV